MPPLRWLLQRGAHGVGGAPQLLRLVLPATALLPQCLTPRIPSLQAGGGGAVRALTGAAARGRYEHATGPVCGPHAGSPAALDAETAAEEAAAEPSPHERGPFSENSAGDIDLGEPHGTVPLRRAPVPFSVFSEAADGTLEGELVRSPLTPLTPAAYTGAPLAARFAALNDIAPAVGSASEAAARSRGISAADEDSVAKGGTAAYQVRGAEAPPMKAAPWGGSAEGDDAEDSWVRITERRPELGAAGEGGGFGAPLSTVTYAVLAEERRRGDKHGAPRIAGGHKSSSSSLPQPTK